MSTPQARSPWPFVVSILGLAVTAAVVLLMLPDTLDVDSGGADPRTLVGLGVLAALFAVGARRWRPAARS